MNILITAGGTSEQIDQVRKITNVSTGKLGSMICNEIIKQQTNKISKIFYVCSENAILPLANKNVEIIKIKSTLDLETVLHNILIDCPIDFVIHSMAVSDYTVGYVADTIELTHSIVSLVQETPNSFLEEKVFNLLNTYQGLDHTKKISSKGNLFLGLKQTPKIISMIKKLQPHTFLVGFKLLDDVSKEELFDTAFQLLRKNHCNLVLANDLTQIRQGRHVGMLVYPEKKYDTFVGKDDIAKNLVDIMFKRADSRHPQSINLTNDAKISDDIFQNVFEVGQELFASGFLPVVETGTYGNLSVKNDKNIIITGRNVNKGNLPKEHLVRIDHIETVDETEVYAKVYYHGGVKPSIDTAIHNALYQLTNHKAIIHIHTDRIFANYPLTNYNYPCGTEKEMESIVQLVKEQPNADVIQMYKHGLIIMGDSLQTSLSRLKQIYDEDCSIMPLNLPNDKGVFNEWLKHYCEVAGQNLDINDVTKYHVLYKGNNKVGILYTSLNSITLDFVVYTLLGFQKKGLGLGKNVIKIVTHLAKNNNINILQLLTTEACGVKDYYIQKQGFSEKMRDGNIIYLIKDIDAR